MKDYEYKKANFDVSQMTVEEVRQRLHDMGFPVDAWQNSEQDSESLIRTLPTFQRQALLLSQLKDLLNKQIDEDKQTINILAEKKARLLHGGGR
jgi:hypothetical protein